MNDVIVLQRLLKEMDRRLQSGFFSPQAIAGVGAVQALIRELIEKSNAFDKAGGNMKSLGGMLRR